jgi:hypothetical protein
MMRRIGVLGVTVLLVSGAALVGGMTSASAASVPPPRTGNVACAADGRTTFRPYLGYSPGKTDRPIPASMDSKWKVLTDLTGCTGTQTGGNPRIPGPIANGDLLIKATGVDHTCQKATDFGASITKVRVRWFDAGGRKLKLSKGTGSITVTGLGSGQTLNPSYVPPGIVTLHVTATIDSTSAVFPGQTLSMTLVGDQTVSGMQQPFGCSYYYAPQTLGVDRFDHTGVHGLSSLSVG